MLPDQGKELLSIGWAAIARALNIAYRSESDERAPWLQELGACFVTLMQDRKLRGYIGSLEAQRSLLMDVKSNAVSAALMIRALSLCVPLSLMIPILKFRCCHQGWQW